MKKRFLAQSYQHFINKYCGGNKNIVLDQMKEYAECFRNNLKPNQCGMSIPKEEGIERINVVIFGLKNTTMIPYILILSRLVDTFFSRISLTMPPAPKSHNTACVLPQEEPLHWQSRSSGYSSS